MTASRHFRGQHALTLIVLNDVASNRLSATSFSLIKTSHSYFVRHPLTSRLYSVFITRIGLDVTLENVVMNGDTCHFPFERTADTVITEKQEKTVLLMN